MKRKPATDMPADFGVSERVRQWAQAHGYDQLDQHLEYFKLICESNGYRYVSYDAAFMRCIRDDWAKLRRNPRPQGIVELAKQRGIEPRVGEEMPEFARRVMMARH